MTEVLRPCDPALDLALRNGTKLWRGDLYDIELADGTTVYHWTTFDQPLTDPISLVTYSSKAPWLTTGKWNVVNTMEIPELTIKLRALNSSFEGGASIKQQIWEGLFDGASVVARRAFMPTPQSTAPLGTIGFFGGLVAGIDVTGVGADISVKGKNNILAQYAPRNVYQIGCLHAFCDAGCTLSRGTFTFTFAVGTTGLTNQFIPWASAPGSPGVFKSGTLRITSGAAAGQSRTILASDSSGLTLAYPLYATPAPGDAFTAFQGCSKAQNDGSGQSCADYANLQHFRAFPFLPPPNAAI